jgi:hypothetical protein
MLPNGVSWKSTAICGIVQEALRRAQLNHSAHDYWMRNDPTYPDRFEEADRACTRMLEDRAFQVARDGVASWCCTTASR